MELGPLSLRLTMKKSTQSQEIDFKSITLKLELVLTRGIFPTK